MSSREDGRNVRIRVVIDEAGIIHVETGQRRADVEPRRPAAADRLAWSATAVILNR